MPPKAKANAAAVPQRSIMSFFGGGSASKTKAKSSGETPTNKVLAKSVSEPMDLTTTTPPKATVEPDFTTPEAVIEQAEDSTNDRDDVAEQGTDRTGDSKADTDKANQGTCGADDHFFGSTFSHRNSSGTWEVYSAATNKAIATAMTASPSGGSVFVSDASSFEVRWGTAATSTKMPKMPTTGLIQVSL